MFSTSPEERESRFPVGSSPKMISGWLASARAQATRCCCPPESSEGRCESRSRRPKVSITSSSQSWSGRRPAMSIGRVMFSSAVSVGTRLKAWNTKPMRSRRSCVIFLSESVVSSVSPISTEPEDAESSPTRQRIRVDLPEPEGPMMAVNSPRANSAETPLSAWT